MQKPLSWWALVYILNIVTVNVGFEMVPPIDLGFGAFSPMAILVGFVFIVRDYTQRAVGKWWMLFYMGIGLLITVATVDPFIALASAAAFLISELVDWSVFTFSKLPFRKRVIVSNVISIPVDSLVFLTIAGFYTPATFGIMTASKAVATAAIWLYWSQTRRQLAV